MKDSVNFDIVVVGCGIAGLSAAATALHAGAAGDAIPGLDAAGETMGLYCGSYPGATSVLRGAVFGRIAAVHAAGRNA